MYRKIASFLKFSPNRRILRDKTWFSNGHCKACLSPAALLWPTVLFRNHYGGDNFYFIRLQLLNIFFVIPFYPFVGFLLLLFTKGPSGWHTEHLYLPSHWASWQRCFFPKELRTLIPFSARSLHFQEAPSSFPGGPHKTFLLAGNTLKGHQIAPESIVT